MTASRDNDDDSFMSRHFPDARRLKQHKQTALDDRRKNPAGTRQASASLPADSPPMRVPGNSAIGPESELYYRGDGIQNRLMHQLKRGQLHYQSRLDLHGFTLEQAYPAVIHFLRDARGAGENCVLIIHGQGYRSAGGIPVLKQNLDYWLRNAPEVLAFHSATPADGGKGAVYVLLRKKKLK